MKVVVLSHNMDLISKNKKEETINAISSLFDISSLENVEIYPTSIYEKSIFEAIDDILA
ncbi:MAG: hypothetical protein HGN29_14870 [Asgard group archaeon]|nr:hypothetical protein [Asgard group archaeon]